MVLLPLLVAGCGGSAPDAAPPTDETLQRETQAGRLAFELERDEEAVARFRAALARAQERDDLDAISNTGFNLAVVELRANAPYRPWPMRPQRVWNSNAAAQNRSLHYSWLRPPRSTELARLPKPTGQRRSSRTARMLMRPRVQPFYGA